MTRHLLDVDDLTAGELTDVLDLAAAYRDALRAGEPHRDLPEATLAMLFEKPSTRTRVSLETGMTQLGGHAVVLGQQDTQLARGEPLADTARALSAYVDAVLARVGDHADLLELADHATVPVVNGLSDAAHPCQALADLLTVRDVAGTLEGATAAWVGDGNNVAASFAVGCSMAGVDLAVATPPGFGLDEETLAAASAVGRSPTTTDDPAAAVADADVVYTDVWVSMGDEAERERRLEALEPYQVNETLLAGTDAAVMHCLPARRGEEITDAVLEGDRSVVWRQAENRLHAGKGLLAWLLAGDDAPSSAAELASSTGR